MMRTISMAIGAAAYYQRGRPLNQVNLAGDNSPPIEIEFRDIENWHGDSEIENYSVNRSIPDPYRDSGRSGDCDGFETFPVWNLVGRNRSGKRKGRLNDSYRI